MGDQEHKERPGDIPNVVVNVAVELQPFGQVESDQPVYFDHEVEQRECFPRVLEPTTLVDGLLLEPACYALLD